MLSCSVQIPMNRSHNQSVLSAVFDWNGKGILALQGASGSGKTSLLKQIAGFREKNKSQSHWIKWHDESWESAQSQLSAYRRPVTLVFQEHPLFPHMNVRQNLEFARQHCYRTITSDEFQTIINDFDLNKLLDHNSLYLSGGQQSRVALVQGLLARPELLLLDEPFSALDFETRHNTSHALKRHVTKLNIAVILVSHAPHELASICDEIITIKQSQISEPQTDILTVLNQDVTTAAKTFLKANLKSYDQPNHLAFFDVSNTEILVASKNKPENTEIIEIPASEVSLVLDKPTATSIANCLPVILESWVNEEDGCLLQLKVNQQLLACKITQYSFDKLKLKRDKNLFVQFKATAITIL